MLDEGLATSVGVPLGILDSYILLYDLVTILVNRGGQCDYAPAANALIRVTGESLSLQCVEIRCGILPASIRSSN